MNTKVLLATLAGGVVSFFAGWILYGILLMDFLNANTIEAARSISRPEDGMIMWALILSCFVWALLLALIFDRWAGISTFRGGAMGGAWVFFLIALGTNMNIYSMQDMYTLTAALVDPIINAVQGVLVGGTVGWVLGYEKK